MSEQPVKLAVENICLRFGGIHALEAVSFEVYEGDILAIIGPNGAGKTSLINSINGFYRPQEGRIIFESYDISNLPAFSARLLGDLPHFSKHRALYQRHHAR